MYGLRRYPHKGTQSFRAPNANLKDHGIVNMVVHVEYTYEGTFR